MPNNILVTGANGQLGSEIRVLSNGDGNFLFTDRGELDITDFAAVETFISKNTVVTVINCAAYTAVDKAECDAQNADLINNKAVENLAKICKDKDIKLVHISTDYVFDGKNHKPYVEEDEPSPIGVYAKTKYDGEKAILAINPQNSIIIRTSWVYSSFGANFVKTMLRLGREHESLGVVFDQVGSPTYARDLAKAILDILPKIKNHKTEIYHFSNEGVVSWYDFAKEIMKMAKLSCNITPIESAQYPTPATRPHYSVFNKAKIKKEFGVEIPYWKDSLIDCLKNLGEKE